MKLRLSKREIILLSVLAVLASITIVYLYLWQPLRTQLFALNQEVAQLESALSRLEPWQYSEELLRAEIDELKNRVSAAAAALELGIPLPEFLVMIEDSADTTGVSLRNTSLYLTELGGGSTMEVSGSYEGVYRFLSILEEHDKALQIESLQLNTQGTEVNGSLRLRLFSGAILGETKEGGYPERSPFAPRR